jgi:fructose-specific phosphotransferase system component IIB
MQFHESCLNVDNNTCFGCIGNLDQNDIQQTKVLSIDIDQTVEPSGRKNHNNVKRIRILLAQVILKQI